VLRENINSIKMNRSENIASYFTRIQQVHDEMSIVGEVLDEMELVKVALKGCTMGYICYRYPFQREDSLLGQIMG